MWQCSFICAEAAVVYFSLHHICQMCSICAQKIMEIELGYQLINTAVKLCFWEQNKGAYKANWYNKATYGYVCVLVLFHVELKPHSRSDCLSIKTEALLSTNDEQVRLLLHLQPCYCDLSCFLLFSLKGCFSSNDMHKHVLDGQSSWSHVPEYMTGGLNRTMEDSHVLLTSW